MRSTESFLKSNNSISGQGDKNICTHHVRIRIDYEVNLLWWLKDSKRKLTQDKLNFSIC